MARKTMARKKMKAPMHFTSVPQADVPQGRNGKHRAIVTKILADLDRLDEGAALRLPLADLTESKAKVRSALNRATRKGGRHVATASDGAFLYVWNEDPDIPRSR
jgi:hypothetical protein